MDLKILFMKVISSLKCMLSNINQNIRLFISKLMTSYGRFEYKNNIKKDFFMFSFNV